MTILQFGWQLFCLKWCDWCVSSLRCCVIVHFRCSQKEKTSIPLMDYVLNVVCSISSTCMLISVGFNSCKQWYSIMHIFISLPPLEWCRCFVLGFPSMHDVCSIHAWWYWNFLNTVLSQTTVEFHQIFNFGSVGHKDERIGFRGLGKMSGSLRYHMWSHKALWEAFSHISLECIDIF